jgi:hypothetical protein
MSWQKATEPTTKFPWYTFGGWFTDDETFQNDFDFTWTAITWDITLYAKWTYSWDFDDLNLYFIKSDWTTGHYTIMDRNMWATEAYNQDWSNQNTGSYWYYYKWWNNQWFTADDPDFANASAWTQSNWWQWPCPTWYHVPTSGEWKNISNKWNDANKITNNKWIQFASDLLLPLGGKRKYDDNSLADTGVKGRYWSSTTTDYASTSKYVVSFYSSFIGFDNQVSSSYGSSVRCFKSPANQTLTIDPNGWTWAVIAFTGTISNWIFTTLDEPTKAGYKFLWWYDAEENGNKVEKWDNVVPALYARWLDIYTLTLNAGTWVVNLWNW